MSKDRSQNKINFKLLLVVLIVGFYIVNGVVITFYSVSMSDKSSTLKSQIEELGEENRKISSELYEKTSLSKVYEESESLGYYASNNVLYISEEKPVAELR